MVESAERPVLAECPVTFDSIKALAGIFCPACGRFAWTHEAKADWTSATTSPSSSSAQQPI